MDPMRFSMSISTAWYIHISLSNFIPLSTVWAAVRSGNRQTLNSDDSGSDSTKIALRGQYGFFFSQLIPTAISFIKFSQSNVQPSSFIRTWANQESTQKAFLHHIVVWMFECLSAHPSSYKLSFVSKDHVLVPDEWQPATRPLNANTLVRRLSVRPVNETPPKLDSTWRENGTEPTDLW